MESQQKLSQSNPSAAPIREVYQETASNIVREKSDYNNDAMAELSAEIQKGDINYELEQMAELSATSTDTTLTKRVLNDQDDALNQATKALERGGEAISELDNSWRNPEWQTLEDAALQKRAESALLELVNRPAAKDAALEKLADRYEIVRKLGVGSQATVYEAIRLSDKVRTAIKVLNIESCQNWKDYELFQREARVLESLNIEGVAKFYEAGEWLEEPMPRAYIVQAFVEGRSIDDMINTGFRLSRKQVFKLCVKLISILEAIHSHEPPVVHRDIKPSNVILNQLADGEFDVHLIDFGAVANPMVQGNGSTIAGTYGYMAPEQLLGTPTPASDIYSLAAMIVYLLSGKSPENMEIRDFRLIIDPYLKDLPPEVVHVLNQMLEPNVQSRLCDYSVLKKLFNNFVEDKFETIAGHSLSPDEFLTKLAEEHCLGQAGSMDIWYALSESTPRPMIDAYLVDQASNMLSHQSINKRIRRGWWQHIFSEIKEHRLVTSFICVSIVFCLLAGVLSMLAGTLGLFEDPYSVGFLPFRNICSLIVCCLSLFFGVFLSLILINAGQHFFVETSFKPKFEANSREGKRMVETIITRGKKMLAVIENIKYIPSSLDTMEKYYFLTDNALKDGVLTIDTLSQEAKHEHNELGIYCHGTANFQVRYKYYPAELGGKKAVIHTIIVHTDPGTVLEEGSLLPILYYIDPKKQDEIVSMPFPYPLYDIVNFKDMYCRSNVNEETEDTAEGESENMGGWV